MYDVICNCGQVHRIKVGESSPYRCGLTVSIRKDKAGWITPWNGQFKSIPKGAITAQIYKKQPSGE